MTINKLKNILIDRILNVSHNYNKSNPEALNSISNAVNALKILHNSTTGEHRTFDNWLKEEE